MKYMGLNELREKYLSFFESKGHLRKNSFSLVPQNDNSLLLINAGMAPLKAYFTGQEIPPSKRMTTCQKCIRTGDIENVGKTARHGTYFEMLGNFSFGDYFKEEAIRWAWEFFTEVLEIPEELLYVSVYKEDDEAEEIWHKKVGLSKDRIFRLGKEDNFWEHGTGPCGPCSEIHVDRGEEYGCGSLDCQVGCDCDRYMEVWNLVFTQFDRTEEGTYEPLANPNIDTGMGLERLAAMMQEVDSIFDVDTIKALRDQVCQIAGVTYQSDASIDVSIRLITDHIRSVTFMTSDGILPSNEGRGYVLRRLLRRAARHGKLLGIDGEFLAKLSATVIEVSKDAYPELADKQDYIYKVISNEEENFYRTIDQGLAILKGYIEELKAADEKVLIGEKCFKLYDTYGFPLDLTKEILEEEGYKADEEGFITAMEEQRVRAREARAESNYMGAAETVYNQIDAEVNTSFVGYDKFGHTSKITVMANDQKLIEEASMGEKVTVLVNETPFYATGGGQIGDLGTIKTKTGIVIIEETKKVIADKIGHIGTVVDGIIKVGQEAAMVVDEANRLDTARNHSATHLLQKALRHVLGNHVEQAGSNVNADRLRFDFTHFTALTPEEVERVENEVNKQVLKGLKIETCITSMDEARNMGAMALFGEKYGDEVRVVNMNDYSVELCGGTHLGNTSQVGVFKLVSEAGVAAGVRRIEALTGSKALSHFREQENQLNEIAALVKAKKGAVRSRVEDLMAELKAVQKEVESLRSKMSSNAAKDVIDQAKNIHDVKFLAVQLDELDMNGLRDMGDKLKDQLGTGVVVLASAKGGKVSLIVMTTKDAIDKGAHAGNIIREAAGVVGGGGGGRPNMAQAGGKDASKIADAFIKAEEVLTSQLS
ncbi:alanine--tRNA ligase [Vallitalea okinawensis]|uniref:alanine--tRNA ligase n=1 Tax=Vallitalea okinawensis TaxID=2078660 RepID=UPI000CFC43A1|nr:alanine--tRNA ligase [Vallitalea okinawensis]